MTLTTAGWPAVPCPKAKLLEHEMAGSGRSTLGFELHLAEVRSIRPFSGAWASKGSLPEWIVKKKSINTFCLPLNCLPKKLKVQELREREGEPTEPKAVFVLRLRSDRSPITLYNDSASCLLIVTNWCWQY